MVTCRTGSGGFWGLPLLLLLSETVAAQSIRGNVLDEATSRPIVAVEISVLDSLGNRCAFQVTDVDGRFQVDVPAGVYAIQFQRVGYQALRFESFEVGPDNVAVDWTVFLMELPVPLDTVVVAEERRRFAPGPLQGFYERMERGSGLFLDREAIESKSPVWFSDILENEPGVRVVSMGGNRFVIQMMGQTRLQPDAYKPSAQVNPLAADALTGACPITYYLDGFKYKVGERGINEIPASAVEAVEVYRRASETPAEFLDSDSRCGVIVIWLKRGD